MSDLPQSFGAIPSPPDERDYKLADYLVPTTTDTRFWQVGPTLDQNPTPQCVAFGFTDWGNCLPVDDGWTADDAHDFYADCKKIDGYAGDGTYPRVAAKVMQSRGRMNKYAFGSIEDMKSFILASGPVPFAVAWNSGMGSPNAEGIVSPSPGGFPLAHCVLAYGADPTYLYFQNSWGPNWGVNGTAKITWGDLAVAWAAYGEACAAVELPLGTPQPQPAPTPKPTPPKPAPQPKKVTMRNLHMGDKGNDVKTLQASLVKLGQRIAVDGDYGPMTAKAVLAVKKARQWPEKPLTTGATIAFQAYAVGWAATKPKPAPKPPSKAAVLRSKIIAGYQSIMGATVGSAIQRAIESFAHENPYAPWCASGFWYVAKHMAGYNGPRPAGSTVASVPQWELFAHAHNIMRSRLHTLPGMAVTYVWSGSHGVGRGDHIGVVVKPGTLKSTYLVADEANAGSPGMVRQETRWWWQVNCVFDIALLQK